MYKRQKKDSPYTVEKQNNNIYRPQTVKLFRAYLTNVLPALNSSKDFGTHFFGIDSNTYNSDELIILLEALDKLGIMQMGVSQAEIYRLVNFDIYSDKAYGEVTSEIPDNLVYGYFDELIAMFKEFREFLVVEYLNSLDSPVGESIIHNRGFYIDQNSDGTFRVGTELENWAGREKKHRHSTIASLDDINKSNTMEHHTQSNLLDLIVQIQTEFQTPEQKAEAVKNLLEHLVPVAKAIDFMNSTKIKKKKSLNGQTVEVDVYKRPFMHFDIKPSNIFGRELFDSQNTTPNPDEGRYYNFVLGDFGLVARPMHPGYGSVSGTPPYIAPEMQDEYLSTDVTKADIYSFTATLFCVLVGKNQIHLVFLEEKIMKMTKQLRFV